MKKSFMLLVALVSLAFSTLSFTCGRDYAEPKLAYLFAEKLTLMPYQKEYAINDTIWMQLQTADKTLFDQLISARIATDTSYMRPAFIYEKAYPVTPAPGVICGVWAPEVANLEIIQPHDNRPYTFMQFSTDCAAKTYFFRVGFVPKQAGIYFIQPLNSLANCPNKRTWERSEFNLTFDLADCNKDIFLTIPPQSRSEQPTSAEARIENKELFYFRVR